MHQRFKGFTLVEMMVTVAVLVIVVAIAVPSFNTLIAKSRADTETGEFYRALNYARLEAINRGVSVRVTPGASSNWSGDLKVALASDTTNIGTLKYVPALSSNSTLTPATATGYLEFNNLGSLVYPAAAVAFTYLSGSITRYVVVCPNGRAILNNGNACT